MRKAYNYKTVGGAQANLFDDRTYFDLGVDLSAKLKMYFGLTPTASLSTFINGNTAYAAAKQAEGFDALRIAAHANYLAHSPLVHVGIDEAANLVFFAETTNSTEFPMDPSSLVQLSDYNTTMLKGLITSGVPLVHQTSGGVHLKVEPQFLETVAKALASVYDTDYSMTPKSGWAKIVIAKAFSGETSLNQISEVNTPFYLKAWMRELEGASRTVGNAALLIPYIANTYNVGGFAHCAGEASGTFYPATGNWNHIKTAMTNFGEVYCKHDKEIARAGLLANHSDLICRLYRLVNQSVSTDDAIKALFNAKTVTQMDTQGLPIYLGQMAVVGRPISVKDFFLKIPLTEIPDIGATFRYRAKRQKMYLRGEREFLKLLLSEYLATKPPEAEPEVRALLQTIATNSEPIRTVVYSEEVDVKTAIESSTLAHDYKLMKEALGGDTDIKNEYIREGEKYGDVATRLAKAQFNDIFTYFDATSGETPRILTLEQRIRERGLGHYVKLTVAANNGVYSTVIACEVDGVAQGADLDFFDKVFGSPGLAYKIVDAGGVDRSAEFAKFRFKTDTLAEALEAFGDNGVTRSFGYKKYIFDSRWLTLSKYPDVLGIDPLYKGQAIMVFKGGYSVIIDRIMKFCILLSPTDEILGDTFYPPATPTP